MHIVIISASVRRHRNSHRVALFFRRLITDMGIATAEILDLQEYQFPLFDERLQFTENPPANVLEFAAKVVAADGVLIVTPEYNGGYPAALKNVIDLLYKEWKKKPLAISTVSDGMFGGTQVITSLVFTMFKIGAMLTPAMYPVPRAPEHYDEAGNVLIDQETTEKRARAFINELMWCIEARNKMKQQ